MKRLNTLSILFVAAMLVSTTMLTSCKKYEEGPAISFRSKKSRVVNSWKVDKIIINGQPESFTDDITFNFKKDNTYEVLYDGEREAGTWDFNSNKEELILKENGSSSAEIWKIIKLKNNELWVEFIDYDDKIEIRFKSK